MKRLRDIPDASFVLATETHFKRVDTADGANALWFECPCGSGHVICVAFEPTINAPLSPGGLSRNGGRWRRESGTTLDDLTLSPPIAISGPGGECWHGFVRNGQVTP